MSGLPHIYLGIAGTECGRPHAAIFHADVHIESGGVDGQIVKAVPGDTESNG